MKKYVKGIMLGISGLFFLGVVLSIFGAIANPAFFRDTEQIMLVALIGLSGLFLGLFRIIDLLERHSGA